MRRPRRRILISLTVLLLMWIGYRGYRITNTSSHSPADTVCYRDTELEICVKYCRPFKKGRVIFGEAKDRAWLPGGKFWTDGFRLLTGLPRTTGALVPNGRYWRLGANYATEISFSQQVDFSGKLVDAGTYRMYATPNQNSWQVYLNSELGQFGYFEPDKKYDVLQVDAPTEIIPETIENFTINFERDSISIIMRFSWDNTLVRIPILKKQIQSQIDLIP